MIDITFDCNTIEIEDKVFGHLGDRNILRAAILELLDKACYSGETITVWEIKGDMKYLVGEFHSAAKNRYRGF